MMQMVIAEYRLRYVALSFEALIIFSLLLYNTWIILNLLELLKIILNKFMRCGIIDLMNIYALDIGGRLHMAVSYDKLWKLLIDKKMNKTQLCEKARISTNAMAKLGKNECVEIALFAVFGFHFGETIPLAASLVAAAFSSRKFLPEKRTEVQHSIIRS